MFKVRGALASALIAFNTGCLGKKIMEIFDYCSGPLIASYKLYCQIKHKDPGVKEKATVSKKFYNFKIPTKGVEYHHRKQ